MTRWVALASLALLACHTTPAPKLPSPSVDPKAQAQLHQGEKHPSIYLVQREGDPSAGIAFAIAHDHGSVASAALSALLRARLDHGGLDEVSGEPHHLGLQLFGSVEGPAEAKRFVQAARSAFAKPVSPGELGKVREAVSALGSLAWGTESEGILAACSGFLGVRQKPGLVSTQQLESWRKAVYSRLHVAFAVVGGAPVLSAAADALTQGEEWPSTAPIEDPWPSKDEVGTSRTDGSARLSLALRVADAGAVVSAARHLGDPRAEVGVLLEALEPRWKLDTVVGTARHRGACLRVDLRSASASVSAEGAARATVLVEQEMAHALSTGADSKWTLREAVLRPEDPRLAASVAAWQALTSRAQAGHSRTLVHLAARSRLKAKQLESALQETRKLWAQPVFPKVARFEAGQGNLWMLLASPCSTLGETEQTAGVAALALSALAHRASRRGFQVRPWITSSGVGLMARGERISPEETAEAHAQRVGAQLGRVLTRQLSPTLVQRGRQTVLGLNGNGPRPGWDLTLQSLAPGHPSWLSPLGTWVSLTNISAQQVNHWRKAFLRQPLRLAVIANQAAAQAKLSSQALSRWIRPHHFPKEACAPRVSLTPRFGEHRLARASPNQIYLAVPLTQSQLGEEARWTQHLFDRRDGWLDAFLVLPGLAVDGSAHLLEGPAGGALVLELRVPEGVADAALTQLRGLLERLVSGAATSADLEVAEAALAKQERAHTLRASHRLGELWRTAPKPDSVTLASLQRFHATVLAEQRQLVVRAPPDTAAPQIDSKP